MATLTAVTVGDRALALVSGRKTPAGVELARAGRAALPEDFAQRTPEQKAEAVKNGLAACGGGDKHVALVIPRSSAIVREFDMPAASPEELQQMVRFQMERELPMPLEQVKYAWTSTPAGESKVRVTAVAVPNDQLDSWIAAFKDADVHVTSVYVSSFGLATLVPQAEGGTALVSVTGQMAEILILDGGSLAFSRSTPIREGADALANEVERTILSYASKNAGREVPNVLVAGEGGDADKLREGLSKTLARKVGALSLNGDISRKSDVSVAMDAAAAAGVVVGVLRGKVALPDVLLPPITKKRFQLNAKHRVGILGGLILVLGFAWAEIYVSDLKSGNEAIDAEIKGKKKEYDAVKGLQEQTKLVGKWAEGTRMTWLRTLHSIQSKVDTKKIYILSMTLDDAGTLSMQGKCLTNAAVSDLVQDLTKDKVLVSDSVKQSFQTSPSSKDNFKTTFSVSAQMAGFEKPAGRRP